MSDKKELENEILKNVTGGDYAYPEKLVVRVCECGSEITLECEMRRNSDGKQEIKCPNPNCGKWYEFDKI